MRYKRGQNSIKWCLVNKKSRWKSEIFYCVRIVQVEYQQFVAFRVFYHEKSEYFRTVC